jgi:DNA adenine methylase
VKRIEPTGRPNGSPTKPPLKWAGGKRWQVPHLEPLWLPHRNQRLVEPFCGGLAVTLGLQPQRALLNDINENLLNFYQWLKRGLKVTIPMENSTAVYRSHRERFNALVKSGKRSSAEAASLFYYLNRTGYNGLCRFNASGEFNVPFGRYGTINYVRDFSDYKTAFKNWDFRVGDFESVPLAADDFVYADPPYDVEFTSYSAGRFSWNDQVRAATWLSEHTGPVVLVNQATDRILALYAGLGYTIETLDAPRRISCNGDRRPAKEVLATRNV